MHSDAARALEQLIESLKTAVDTTGILLHGSFARGSAGPDSDIDVFCVTTGVRLEKEVRTINGYDIEVDRMPVAVVRTELQRELINNDNVVLNALTCGRILYDRAGLLRSLVEKAQCIRAIGPRAPSRGEIEIGHASFAKRISELKRSGKSAIADELRKVTCAFLFSDCVYAYCRTHRRWASRLDHVVEDAQREDPEFYQLCIQYLHAKSLDEEILALGQLIDATLDGG